MPKSRLNLDFSIESQEERNAFVQQYMAALPFEPNSSELETISNYILWGKNPDGLNPQQEGSISLKEWTNEPLESLEGLMELPGFRESSLHDLDYVPTKIRRHVFSRSDALRKAPAYLQDTLKALFKQIDEIELIINYYDIQHARRRKEPRASLVSGFNELELLELEKRAAKLTMFQYLKLRHLIVDLRREQYTISDSYETRIQPLGENYYQGEPDDGLVLGENVKVLPLGVNDGSYTSSLFFTPRAPGAYSENDIETIKKFLAENQKSSFLFIDFTDTEHLLKILQSQVEFQEDENHSFDSTIQFYVDRAELTDIQLDILQMKLAKRSNIIIAEEINKKYNRAYNDNYISTIFHKKIIPQIAAAAQKHREYFENVMYPSHFKTCRDCGKIFLLNSENFVRQKKSNDGFSPRCKACEKIKRDKRNGKI